MPPFEAGTKTVISSASDVGNLIKGSKKQKVLRKSWKLEYWERLDFVGMQIDQSVNS